MATTVDSTIGGTTPDYASISLWESDTDNDLVTADEVQRGLMRAVTLTEGGIYILGATTDATRYRELTFDTGARYDAVGDTGAKVTSADANRTIRPREAYFLMGGIAIANTDTGKCVDSTDTGVGVIFDGVTAIAGASSQEGFGGAAPVTLRNCLAYQTTLANTYDGINLPAGGKAHNCTVRGWHDGVQWVDHADTEVVNCVSEPHASGGAFDSGGTGTSLGVYSYNVSTDTTAPGTNASTSEASADIWEDAANNDFTLKAGSAAIDNAKYLGAVFTTSIDGTDRGTTASEWDAGPYDYSVASGVTVTPSAASITLGASTGSIISGSLSLTPASSLITLGAATGSILAGSLAITPANAQLTLGAGLGSVIAGSLSVTPSGALVNLGAAVGAVLGGGLVVSPAAAQLILGAQAGSILRGSLAITPSGAQIVLGADGTVVVPSGVVVTPASAQITLAAALGGVVLGSLAVTPASAQIALGASGSTIIPDGVLIAPARAILTLLASGTALGGGYVYVSPSPATLTLGAQMGAVVLGSVTTSPPAALLDLKAKIGYVESQEGWALNLSGQGASAGLFANVGDVNPHGGGEGINEDTGSFCPRNPDLLFELYHPASDSEPESLLVSEIIKDYGMDERILIRKPSGTIGYMRPLYCRFALMDPEAGTECINEAMISLVFGRMKQ